ncbi:hypothetical protein AVEN_232006-1 [Araneus ventricosus]|uniref:Uncharacterized protein n=1 Tax=Araneus ventricosus TaxID=182803 RepID=A0A4Y2LGG9_ARAVE|nr:hypothetical protein AVEN_232006-1 [Araneus ventricosus]
MPGRPVNGLQTWQTAIPKRWKCSSNNVTALPPGKKPWTGLQQVDETKKGDSNNVTALPPGEKTLDWVPASRRVEKRR